MRLHAVEHGHRLTERLKLMLIRVVSLRRVPDVVKTLLPAGILRPPDVRLDASGDARALIVERGRAGAVCRVHLTPEPMSILNRCARRGRVAGPEARGEERQAGRGGAGGLAYGAARPEAACHARLPRKAHARAHGGGVGGRETTPGCRREG